MKKTYRLDLEGKNRDRLLDAAKHDIRKYAKRERARALPAGVDYWDFDCKVGTSLADAATVHFAALIAGVDALAKSSDVFYVEVLTKPGRRNSSPTVAPESEMSGPPEVAAPLPQ